MSKFHINSKGAPAPCKATKGNCPFGGADSHYDTIEKAQEAADKQGAEKHNLLPGTKSSIDEKPSNRFDTSDLKYSMEPMLKLRNNDVLVVLATGEQIKGILTNDSEWQNLRIMPYGGIDKNNTINLKPEEIEYIDKLSYRDESGIATYSHNKSLRESNKARPEFRFSVNQMRDISNKFVKIKYDNKEFDGKVIDFYSDGEDNSGLIIEHSNGSIKQIKNYRLQKLEITGDNEAHHAGTMKTYEIIDNIEQKYIEDEEYITMLPEDIFDDEFEKEYGPQQKVNEYFKLKIDEHSGKKVNLDKYENIDWNSLVAKNKDIYNNTTYSWDSHGGGMNDEWNEESEVAFENALEMSDNAYVYFAERQDLINDTIEEVKKTDWTSYYDTQLEGELAALNKIYNNGVVCK